MAAPPRLLCLPFPFPSPGPGPHTGKRHPADAQLVSMMRGLMASRPPSLGFPGGRPSPTPRPQQGPLRNPLHTPSTPAPRQGACSLCDLGAPASLGRPCPPPSFNVATRLSSGAPRWTEALSDSGDHRAPQGPGQALSHPGRLSSGSGTRRCSALRTNRGLPSTHPGASKGLDHSSRPC